MAATMLTPNPNKPGSIARVVVVGDDAGNPIVLDISSLFEHPQILQPLNPGFVFAIRFWKFSEVAAVIAGIALGFLWHWWAVLIGLAATFFIDRANRRSAGNFALQALREDPKALAYFRSLNLVWVARKNQVVSE